MRRTLLGVVVVVLVLGFGFLSWQALAGPTRATATNTPERTQRPLGDPVDFLAGVIRLIAANRYAQAWKSLSPRDQSLAPQSVYVACESASPIPGHLVSLRTLDRSRDRIGVVAKFAVRIAGAAMPQGTLVDVTAHAVVSGGRWAWILPPDRRRLYRNGCGSAHPAA